MHGENLKLVFTKFNQRSFERVIGKDQTSGSSIYFLPVYKAFRRMRFSRGKITSGLYPAYRIAATNIFHGY
jgi:hypothetical protein